MNEYDMTNKELIALGIKKTNLLKSEIDSMNLKQCKIVLNFLAEKTRNNNNGSATVLHLTDNVTDLFIHTFADGLELAGAI